MNGMVGGIPNLGRRCSLRHRDWLLDMGRLGKEEQRCGRIGQRGP